MSTPRRWLPGPFSLKTRFSLALGILIVFTAAILTIASVFIVQRGIEDVVGEREASLISQLARDLDQKFALRQTALAHLAIDLDLGTAVDADHAGIQQKLARHHSLDGMFTNLAILDAEGEQVANLDRPKSLGKVNLADRDYVVETLRRDAAVISRPLLGMVSGRPLIIMTAPIHGPDGKIRYMLLGSIDLARDSFLKELAHGRVGKTGYFYIFNKEGVFVSHPDPARILGAIGEPGARQASIEQALAGYEGTLRATSETGAEALVSYKRMQSTGWIVSAVYPTAEAFAFAGEVRWNAAIIAALLLLVIAPVAWLVIDSQLLPLTQLAERMAAGRDVAQEAVHYKDDEIGELWRAFDTVMAERDQAERAMAQSDKNLRMVANNMPALVAYVDRDERIVFANLRFETYYNCSPEQIMGKTVREVMGETIYAISKQYIDAALSGRAVRFERQVERQVGRQNVAQWDRVAYNPDIDRHGVLRGYFVLVDDITELKATQVVLANSEKRIRTIADNMPAMIGYIDTEQRYRFCNSAYLDMTGMPPAGMLGRTVREVFGPEIHATFALQMADALLGKRVSFERPASEFGAGRHLQYVFIPDMGSDGKVVGLYSMITDISERKASEITLRAQQQLLHTVTDNLPALVNFIDASGRFGFVNRHHQNWFTVPLHELVGKQVTSVLSEPEAAVHLRAFHTAMTGQSTKFEFARKLQGELRHFHATYLPQFESDGAVAGITSLVNDVTDAKLVEKQLNDLARFDDLTGLPNRTQINERIGRAQVRSARSGNAMAVMYLDLDKFKSINDNFGHSGGDAVLVEFGRRLSACVRQTDTVGRLAGDEFVILLEGLQSVNECTVVARKILKAMEKPFDINGVARIVTTSIGVATAQSDSKQGETLLKHADDALYRAKETGRNRYAMTAVK